MQRDDDTGIHLVPELRPLSADPVEPASRDRTRVRCLTLLARRRRSSRAAAAARELAAGAWALLEPALVSALVVVYLGGAVEKAFRLLVR